MSQRHPALRSLPGRLEEVLIDESLDLLCGIPRRVILLVEELLILFVRVLRVVGGLRALQDAGQPELLGLLHPPVDQLVVLRSLLVLELGGVRVGEVASSDGRTQLQIREGGCLVGQGGVESMVLA